MLLALRDWIDARLPIMRAWNTHMAKYYAPKNFNFWYYFGVLSLVVLIIQLVSGIWLCIPILCHKVLKKILVGVCNNLMNK